MRVKIKRIDKNLPLPKYETEGSVAFDCVARETVEIPPRAVGRVPLNIVVEIPAGFMLMLKDRSGTMKKKGLISSLGFIDQDYCGENDEIMKQFYNPQDAPVVIERGERLAQASFVRIETAEWEEVEKMEKKNRGGFGSTG